MAARDAVRRIIGEVDEEHRAAENSHIPFTRRSKSVLEDSLREAVRLGHRDIGVSHLALALVNQGEGRGTEVLADLGIAFDELRPTLEAAAERECG